MEEAEKILAACRQLLADQRQQLEGLLGDPRAFQWRGISFEVHGDVLQALGVSAEAGKAAGPFYEQGGRIFEHLDSCRNELANQETDLRFSAAPPERVLEAANHLARQCDRLRQPFADLQSQFAVLCQAEKTLRQKLRLENLISLAENKNGGKGDAFDAGYRVFCLVTGIGSAPGTIGSYQEQFAEATELKSRLQHLDLQDLPSLAAEIVQQQVAFGIDTVEQVKNILDHGRHSLSQELDTVQRLTTRMAALAKAPLPEIMENMNEIVAALSDCILKFSYKKHLVQRLQAVTAVLDDLKLFNRALKSDILASLRKEIHKPGSPLNPATLAARNAEKYFGGCKGFWRMVKLFLQGAGSGKALDTLSLQLTLERAIGDCTAYAGSQEVDLDNLRAFMAARLRDYGKPFPHDDLLRLMRGTLDAYAGRVEKALYGYRIAAELLKEFSAGAGFLKAGSLTFGKLLRSVQRQTDSLERGLA